MRLCRQRESSKILVEEVYLELCFPDSNNRAFLQYSDAQTVIEDVVASYAYGSQSRSRDEADESLLLKAKHSAKNH